MKQGVKHYCLSKYDKKFYIVNKKRKGDIIRLCELQGSMIEGEEDCKHVWGRKEDKQCSLSVRVSTLKISKVFSR